MHLIDTHTHLYLEHFDSDRDDMLQRAFSAGIHQLFLPNIDMDSLQPMLELCRNFPSNCFPMIGLHPTSVGENVNEQLRFLEEAMAHSKFYAIGEIGIDLYWDKTFIDAQITAFRTQLDWAKKLNLPVVIHTRDAFPLILDLVEEAQDGNLTGVFHCFTGDETDAKRIMDMNFMIGIGGVITYKKSHLPEVLQHVPLDFMVLETDSPYLPPVPYRGKRNESSYMIETALKLAEIKGVSMEEIAMMTTRNAQKLFKISTL